MFFFLSLFSILGICFFLTVFCKVNPSSTPIVAMGGSIFMITLFGIMNLLTVGFVLVYAFSVLGVILVLAKRKAKLAEIAKEYLTPGIVFFIVASVFFYFLLMDIDPDFRYWDEYSFWGIAAKTIWTEKKLYTLVDNSMIVSAYLPGLPLTGLLFQYFSSSFSEWQVYLGYDVLMMAAVTPLFSRNTWKNVGANIACTAFGLCSVYAFHLGSEGMFAYANAYSDIPLGMVFGSVLLLWYVPKEKGLREYLSCIVALVMLALVKDMGVALGMIASGTIAVDIWLTRDYPLMKSASGKAKVIRFFLVPIIPMATLCGVYFGWLKHFTAVTGIVSSDIGYKYSMVEIFSGKDPYFIDTLNRMWQALSVRQIIAFGPMKTMIIVFTITALLATAVSHKKKEILRTLSFVILLFAGFVVYYLFHAYLYTAVFYHSGSMSSYNRYMSTYAIVGMIAIGGLSISDTGDCGLPKLSRAWGAIVMIVSVVSTFYFNPIAPDQYVIAYKKRNLQHIGLTDLFEKDYRTFYGLLDVNDKIYFVCQESDGGEWFIFNYEFLPAFTVSTLGGGNFVETDQGGLYDVEVDAEKFVNYLRENEIDYIYVAKSNDYFREEFGSLFKDHLEGFYDGSVKLYKISEEDGTIQFIPIYTREGLEYLKAQE